MAIVWPPLGKTDRQPLQSLHSSVSPNQPGPAVCSLHPLCLGTVVISSDRHPPPPQAVPGTRGEAMDQHRWQNHGHHREGAEAPPPLCAGCSADPYLHAHEEGRRVLRVLHGQGAPSRLSGKLLRCEEREVTCGTASLVLEAELPAVSSSYPTA